MPTDRDVPEINAQDDDRRQLRSSSPFAANTEINAQRIHAIEGAANKGELWLKPLIVGDESLAMEVYRKKGLIDPEHAHVDHESVCYLVKGRMRVVIAGESFIAEAGDSWVHRRGVRHYHETLEDSIQIEIKSPPVKTWS